MESNNNGNNFLFNFSLGNDSNNSPPIDNEIDMDNIPNEDYEEYPNEYEVDVDENTAEFQIESLYLNAEKEPDPIKAYLDIITMDESKDKRWAYKSYQSIAIIYIKRNDAPKFHYYYKKLFEIGKNVNDLYIKETVSLFIKALIDMKNSIAFMRWLEELELPFNIKDKDHVKQVFEAALNLYCMKLQMILESNSENAAEEIASFSNNLKSQDLQVNEIIFEKYQLKELTYNFLIKECGISPSDLDERGNTSFYRLNSGKRGGEDYLSPSGWYGFGINVNKYGTNLDWLANDGRPGEWAVAYHGFGGRMSSNDLKKTIKIFVKENLKPGEGQACAGQQDVRHPGQLCGKGVYVAPNINVALGYSGRIQLGNDYYHIIIMVRCKPDKIRCAGNTMYLGPKSNINTTVPNSQTIKTYETQQYWILDGNSNQLRPYRILLKKVDPNYRYNY